MSEFVIIPDSSCNMHTELRDRFGVPDYVDGLIYFPDGHEEIPDLDWKVIDPETFYNSMSDKKTIYKTAPAPAGKITEVYENQLKQGKDILAITLSTGLSGTYQTCELIKESLLKQYPDRKIIIVDSLRYSFAIALLVWAASMMKDNGATLEETAEYLNKIKHNVHQIGPMDDLFFLVKTGRISNFKAFFGKLIGINPMADFNRQGMSEVLGKFKGKKAAFDGVIKYMKQTILEPEKQIIFIGHSNRLEAAKVLRDMVQKEFSPKEIIISDICISCGASIGPGLCAAFYFGKEISTDLKVEKEIIDNILAEQAKK